MKITDELKSGWENMEELELGELIASAPTTCTAAGLGRGWKIIDWDEPMKWVLFACDGGVFMLVHDADGQGPYACEVN